MTKTAWVFPRHSQAIGMGMDLLELSAAKDKFAQAEEIWAGLCLKFAKASQTNIAHALYPTQSVC